MDYVLIKNGQLIVDNEIQQKDLLIANTKIISIGDDLKRPEPETPIIDANGKYLFPGAIDSNASFLTQEQDESNLIERFNRSEISSGTTTVIECLLPFYAEVAKDEMRIRFKNRQHILSDFSYHLSLQGWDSFDSKQLDYYYSHEGIASYYLKWPIENAMGQEGIRKLIREIAKLDLLLVVEMQIPIVFKNEVELGGNDTVKTHLENLGSILKIVEEEECKVCFFNLCFKEELLLIKKYMTTGRVFAEISLPYHIGNSSKYDIDEHTVFSGFALQNKLNLISQDEYWELLKDEHFLVSRPFMTVIDEGVLKNSQVKNRPDEYFLLKNFLSVLYTVGVQTGKLSVKDFISIISTRPAKLFGLYPKKGMLRPGADADIVIWDPAHERNLYCNLSYNFV